MMTQVQNGRIFIVSGLPRSGTSMMMRMLSNGGITPLTDGLRQADIDNPNGYFEFEDAKAIETDSSWLEAAVGRATKMVSMLLPKLPPRNRYHVIFMRRDLDEILASQRRMLERNGKSVTDTEQADLERFFTAHLREITKWLMAAEHIDVTFVKYRDVIEKPGEMAQALADFTGVDLDIDRMVETVDPSLYRQRSVAS